MVITTKAVLNDFYKNKSIKLLDTLGIKYNDISLYILCFIHRSIVNERPDFTPNHNERLEFLGDAVLELAITDFLYKDFPDKSEGELTDIRSALVRGKNLALIARKLNFADYLLLGKGEEKTGGRENDYILANTVEAVIGAIYLDAGMDIATKFIFDNIYTTLEDILDKNLTKDYKTLFQELSQSDFESTPDYRLISHSGPDHDKNFEVGVYNGDKLFGIGVGSSKKKAQEDAAKVAYLKITNKQ